MESKTTRIGSKEKPNTASSLQISMILLGILVTPVLLASARLGSNLPLNEAALVIGVGSLILTIFAVINISIGEKARLPTYGIIKFSFGQRGAVVINILMAISLFGWIAVTANSFGHSVQDLLATFGIQIPLGIIVALGCVIFVASTAFGFEMLGKVSKFAVPIIVILMLTILYFTVQAEHGVRVPIEAMSFGTAVSSIVGTISVLVVTSPDFGSFVHNRKHAVIAGILTFAIAYPALYFIGAVPSSLTGKGSLLEAMAMIGMILPATFLLIFACITGNAGNMFQGTLVVSTLFSQFPKWQITIALGILATIVGSVDIQSLFVPFLLFLGICTPPICGIYVADFFLYRKQGYNMDVLEQSQAVNYLTFVAWIAGSLVGFATVNAFFTFTSIPSLDSMIVASLCYILFAKLRSKI